MRIIGGQFRSRVLASFDGDAIRPTGDRAKEALFNILSPRTYGARVLDLFCGSGALGLESISRGAREAVFNDASKDSLAVLRKNLKTLNVQAKVYNLDYTHCLSALSGEFDIIFIDPPYRMDYGVSAMNKIAEKGLLSEKGVIVYERDRPFADENKLTQSLKMSDERKYGKTYLSFFVL
ncbi:MAG: 16S rRNA (guanine(966)-N(2))-methyltransferase RsmD, partial [Clostridia bacterium]|nr:16S rRNA (guanine(966)-N(2))-methyltransferase RsmD [Clostridia bacterium]